MRPGTSASDPSGQAVSMRRSSGPKTLWAREEDEEATHVPRVICHLPPRALTHPIPGGWRDCRMMLVRQAQAGRMTFAAQSGQQAAIDKQARRP